MSRWRSRLWQVLGGSVDEEGNPATDPDEWVVVFQGRLADTTVIEQVLGDAGIESQAQAFGETRLGEPAGIVWVRWKDRAHAQALAEESPHHGDERPPQEPTGPKSPVGWTTVATCAERRDAEHAFGALRQAGVRSILVPPPTAGDPLGYSIRVGSARAWEDATEVLRGLAGVVIED